MAKQAKNIVLCSDGTGNSAAKFRGTNVRRVFESVDRSGGTCEQVAFYDDGVGTAGSRILRTLGGAFGWGLSRNIKELYSFLVHNYESEAKIFMFGFSRGAYTVRALAGMVLCAGLIAKTDKNGKPLLEHQIDGGVDLAYRAFRDSYGPTLWLRLIRALGFRQKGRAADRLRETFDFNIAPGADKQQAAKGKDAGTHDVGTKDIEFVGVWDTVDAVGLPIDEVALAFDKLFWRFRFDNHVLSDRVRKGCQAIAIDDARHTFHPVLWEERDEAREDGERGQSAPASGLPTQDDLVTRHVEQVWFAGMHADVGGGYPEEELSLVSLNWMMERAEKFGLKFSSDRLKEFEERADPHGKLHNSRAGLASFYRYMPRYAESVGDTAKQRLSQPLVHHSVMRRISEGHAGYAPALLAPGTGFVVVGDRTASGGADRTHTAPATAPTRGVPPECDIDVARGINWWRCIHYIASVVFFGAVVFVGYWPSLVGPYDGGSCLAALEPLRELLGIDCLGLWAPYADWVDGGSWLALQIDFWWSGIVIAMGTVKDLLPGFTDPLFVTYGAHPLLSLTVAVVGVVLFVIGLRLSSAASRAAQTGWLRALGGDLQPVPKTWAVRLALRIRRGWLGERWDRLKRIWLPGLLVPVLITGVVALLLWMFCPLIAELIAWLRGGAA